MGQSAAVPNQYRCPPHSALGYRKTSAVDGDQQSARPNAGLLSSAEQCAHRLPVKRSPDPSDLRRQIPGLTAPQRAESKYGREWNGAKITHMRNPDALPALESGL